MSKITINTQALCPTRVGGLTPTELMSNASQLLTTFLQKHHLLSLRVGDWLGGAGYKAVLLQREGIARVDFKPTESRSPGPTLQDPDHRGYPSIRLPSIRLDWIKENPRGNIVFAARLVINVSNDGMGLV